MANEQKVGSIIIPKFGKETPAEKAAALMEAVQGSLPAKLFYGQVLVAKFIRTTIGSSGRLIAAEDTKTEDRWQGKAGLVLQLGPAAFCDDNVVSYFGCKADVGDWVLFDYSDGMDIDLIPPGSTNKIRCKLIDAGLLKGVIADPEQIY